MLYSYSNLCYSITIILLFVTTPTQCATSSDTIKQTCRKCADKSNALDFDLCVSSLQNRPSDNLHGLAVASMLQALDNATATVSTIKKLMNNKDQFDAFAQSCLRDCLRLYSDGADAVADAVRSFQKGQYGTANVRLSAAMDAAVTCEESFGERGGAAASPVRKENHDLVQLTEVALCIVSMISPSLRS